MIPQFPEFKKLELQDKIEVDKYTQEFLPYSDFNFVSLWAWDIKEQVKLSILHNNLVVKFTDYLSGEPFYSFIGLNSPNETACKLLDYSISNGLKPELKLIPEDVIPYLDQNIISASEDRDNYDYIYEIADLKDLSGKRFHQKSTQMRFFSKIWPHAKVEILNLSDPSIQNQIHDLYLVWIEHKMAGDDFSLSHEDKVIQRILLAANDLPLLGVGVFIGQQLIAFFLNELTATEFAIGHISKMDKTFPGLNAFLMKKNAEILFNMGKTKLNTQQDLGIENLRIAKMRFRPSLFFKQYKLTYVASKLL